MVLLTPLTITLLLYLKNECDSTMILQEEEIANIISSLNSNKTSDLNSIPYRILFLFKNEI